MTRLPVTYLFVPGNRPERFAKAAEASPGAARVDGRMVDKPVLLKAQALLARV